MLQRIDWQATDNLVRAQLELFHRTATAARMTEADRRQALQLDEGAWSAWSEFSAGGPLPPQPALPDLLQRLASTSFGLASKSEIGLAA